MVTTGPGDLYPSRVLNRVIGTVVNVFRSIPFIILMISILPFTRLVVGTTLGWEAAVVPLGVAVAQRLHLAAAEHDACLERFEDVVVAVRAPVARDELVAGWVAAITVGGHGTNQGSGTLPARCRTFPHHRSRSLRRHTPR